MMLIVRFSETFRERAPEWIMSLILAGWGIQLLLPGDMFSRPFFHAMAAVAGQHSWGLAMLLIGISRLVALYINGSRHETPTVRQIGCFFGMTMWLGLSLNAISMEWRTTSAVTYPALLALEMIMFSYAARDAARVALQRKANGRGRI